jgi:NADPH:quinone reductase-like Zn-dependent oxidoreductase
VIALGTEDLATRVAELHAERPFDAVLDYLWGRPAAQTLTGLSSSHPAAHYHATRFVQIGSMAGPTLELDAGVLRGNGITVSGVGIGSVPPEALIQARTDGLTRMFAMVAAGELELRTLARPLADVSQVWTAREPSGTRVVLTP